MRRCARCVGVAAHRFCTTLSHRTCHRWTNGLDTDSSGLTSAGLTRAGNFDMAHCIGDDRHEADTAVVKAAVEKGEPARCEQCGALLKPDIVFFGEALPARFWQLTRADFPECDLLLVMGTSLVVNPFASLIGHVEESVPRVLINREKAGHVSNVMAQIDKRSFNFGQGNYRDVFHEGDCDAGCTKLADLLGWGEDLARIVAEVKARFPAAAAAGGNGETAPASAAAADDAKEEGGGGAGAEVGVAPQDDDAAAGATSSSPY